VLKVSDDGALAYEVPDDGPITAAQLRALLTP
jgi:hypothetical protein